MGSCCSTPKYSSNLTEPLSPQREDEDTKRSQSRNPEAVVPLQPYRNDSTINAASSTREEKPREVYQPSNSNLEARSPKASGEPVRAASHGTPPTSGTSLSAAAEESLAPKSASTGRHQSVKFVPNAQRPRSATSIVKSQFITEFQQKLLLSSEGCPIYLNVPVAKNYALGKTLGRGGFAICRLGTELKSGIQWAVKVVNLKALNLTDDRWMLENEVEILRRVKHDNVVSLHEVYLAPDMLSMVLDLCRGGELFRQVVERGHFTEESCRLCMKEILSAVAYLHSIGIIHRDLKPENILLKDTAIDSPVQLTDFGLAGFFTREKMTEFVGTIHYMAPEVILGHEYSMPVDVWSTGVVMFVLLGGYLPFEADNEEDQVMNILHGKANFEAYPEVWADISPTGLDLLKKMLVVDPEQRITAEVALTHPWFLTKSREKHLGSAMELLAEYNSRRKLKAAMQTVLAVTRLKGSTSTFNKLALTQSVLTPGGSGPVGSAATLARGGSFVAPKGSSAASPLVRSGTFAAGAAGSYSQVKVKHPVIAALLRSPESVRKLPLDMSPPNVVPSPPSSTTTLSSNEFDQIAGENDFADEEEIKLPPRQITTNTPPHSTPQSSPPPPFPHGRAVGPESPPGPPPRDIGARTAWDSASVQPLEHRASSLKDLAGPVLLASAKDLGHGHAEVFVTPDDHEAADAHDLDSKDEIESTGTESPSNSGTEDSDVAPLPHNLRSVKSTAVGKVASLHTLNRGALSVGAVGRHH